MINSFWLNLPYEEEDRLVDLSAYSVIRKTYSNNTYYIIGFSKYKEGEIYLMKTFSKQERDEMFEKIKQ